VAICGALLLFGSIILSAIIVPQWRRVRQTDAETKLKHELLAAGMSAADIVQVVQASATNSSAASRPRQRDPHFAAH
jgi:hypothetical protein